MPVTLTNNYKEIYSTETVEKIDELLEENYELTAILKFIDNNSEDQFHDLYEEYVSQGENLGYDVVNAFVELNGIDCVAYCQDAYRGSYDSEADFAEEFTNDVHGGVPDYVCVDWEKTWEQYLSYDYDFVNGFIFSSNF
jgi:hypothetical protein